MRRLIAHLDQRSGTAGQRRGAGVRGPRTSWQAFDVLEEVVFIGRSRGRLLTLCSHLLFICTNNPLINRRPCYAFRGARTADATARRTNAAVEIISRSAARSTRAASSRGHRVATSRPGSAAGFSLLFSVITSILYVML
jgi:hypothetical protein